MKICTTALLSAWLTALPLLSFSASAASLQYEPAVVELSGTVVLEEHFGPPCYGDEPKTDSIELIAVLVLDAPVSVEGKPGDLINQPYSDVRRVQLVRSSEQPRFSPYQGTHVVVSGTLFAGHTGHHHTDVLIVLRSIAAR